MLRVLYYIICSVFIVILLAAVSGALLISNARRERRCEHIAMPVITLLVGFGIVTDFGLAQRFFSLVLSIVPFFNTTAISLWAILAYNLLYVLCLDVIKLVSRFVVKKVTQRFDRAAEILFGGLFEHEAKTGRWFVKEEWLGLRNISLVLFVTSIVVSGITLIPFGFGYTGSGSVFYPTVGVAVAGELFFLLNGETKKEHLARLHIEVDKSSRQVAYGKIAKSIKRYFGDYQLYFTSFALNHMPAMSDGEYCESLAYSKSHAERLAGLYYGRLVKDGVLGVSQDSRFDELDRSAVLSSIKLLDGKSVVFANPFYNDYVPYVFLAVNAYILRNRHVVVVCGSNEGCNGIKSFINEGSLFATNVPEFWTAGRLAEDGSATPDIAILAPKDFANTQLLLNNKSYVQKAGLVMVMNPLSLLGTYPVSLNLFSYLSNVGGCAYCFFERNSDGLVDSLSHAFCTSIVDVNATEKSQGSVIGAFWDERMDGARQRINAGIVQNLGGAPELGFVALKSQAPKVTWIGHKSVPVIDQRWIVSQYFGELLDFAELPQDQAQLDRCFEFTYDASSVKKLPERFIMVEDESFNMFEAYRQYATRGSRESFVNVLCPNYLLRSYMVANPEVFENDPKAVPSIAPDYSKSVRNMTLALVARMLNSSETVSDEEVEAQFRYVGIPTSNIQGRLNTLLDAYLPALQDDTSMHAHDYLVVKVQRTYNSRADIISERNLYCLRRRAKVAESFRDLINVPLITEETDGNRTYLDARLFGMVWQTMLPGQFVVLDGKYYEVLSIASDTGVLLRRASDFFTHRRYYRQMREYRLHMVGDDRDRESPLRTARGVRVYRLVYDVEVHTAGYLEFEDFSDLRHAHAVEVKNVPVRHYVRKHVLKVVFPSAGDAIIRTLALVMNEVLVTLFPELHDFVAVLTPAANMLPKGLMGHVVLSEPDLEKDASSLYVVEDCITDMGTIDAVERNLERILELCTDYLAWREEGVQELAADERQTKQGVLAALVQLLRLIHIKRAAEEGKNDE